MVKVLIKQYDKSIRMMNNGPNMLDEILKVGKMSKNMKGIGFGPRSMSKKDKTQPKTFVPYKNKNKFQMLDHMA